MRVVTCDLTTCLLPACYLLLTAYCMVCYQGERGSVAARFRWLLVVACCLASAGVGSACRILDEAEAWALVSWLVGWSVSWFLVGWVGVGRAVCLRSGVLRIPVGGLGFRCWVC